MYTFTHYRAYFEVIEKKTLAQPDQSHIFEPKVIERYEELRIEILKPNSSLPYGYSFFINKGLLAWCRSDQTSTQKKWPGYIQNDKLLLSEEAAKPIVLVLTNMIIQTQQETSYGI